MKRVPQNNYSSRGVKGVPPSVRVYSPPLKEISGDQFDHLLT